MAEKRTIVIDPVTRIEGHLKITLELTDGVVSDAFSSGTMARGIEAMLLGRSPHDAPWVTSRLCGVCFSVHQFASLQALEMAFGAKVPWPGQLMRNLIMGAEYLYDHILHFYQLSALDYLDITAVASYTGSDEGLRAVAGTIAGLGGDTGPFTPRYALDEFCVRDPEVVTSLVSHYVQALGIHSKARQMGALLGGRAPHYQSQVVGGFTQLPDEAVLARFRSLLDEVGAFVKDVYVPDVLGLATGPLASLGALGDGHHNYLSYGSFALDAEGRNLLFPAGVVRGWQGGEPRPETLDPSRITESVRNAWYQEAPPVHPSKGVQAFDLDKAGAYSFVKAPRYDGLPFETGPLARLVVARDTQLQGLLSSGMKPGVLARHAARALETPMILDACFRWLDLLAAEMKVPGLRIHDTAHWLPPEKGEGYGFYEAPRGALGHWVRIRKGVIAGYQAVVPTTWNASPRCEAGWRGPYEQSLVGTPIPDPENPIHAVRVVRSFDPCLACAIHLVDGGGRDLGRFVVP